VQGLWDATIKSVQPAQIGVLAPPFAGSICLDIDVVMPNISDQTLNLNHDGLGFQLYDTQVAVNGPCPLTTRSPGGSVVAGSMTQGEFAFAVPSSEKEFLLDFQPQIDCNGQGSAPTV
jgi:hypothetical protein